MQFSCAPFQGKIFDRAETEDLAIEICRTGAEPISIARRTASGWVGFLYRDGKKDAPAAGWANHATVMGYFIHRLWEQKSMYRGREIRGGNHGFLRHFSFGAPEVDGASLTYTVPAGKVPPEAYPLPVGARISYTLEGTTLRVGFAFTNESPEVAHLSFGLHPGFAVGSVDEAQIVFPPGRYIRHFAPGNFLNGKTEIVDFEGGLMPFDKSRLEDSFLLDVSGVPERIFQVISPTRKTLVKLDFAEVPFVTVWSDSKDFVCVEPCWGLPDSNPPVPFEEKAGIQTIAPGETLRRSFSITPELLP